METLRSLIHEQIRRFESWSPFIIRLTIAAVMWPHGAQLLLGWFGGNGFSASMQFFTQQANLPYIIGFLVVAIQFFGSLFIAFGLVTRLNAFLMLVITIGMIFSGHIEHGFFMNWFGVQKGEGFEFHILLAGLCLTLTFLGGGKYSIDDALFKRSLYVAEY